MVSVLEADGFGRGSWQRDGERSARFDDERRREDSRWRERFERRQ